MRNKSRWLALMLTGSMMISPLSYTRTYAAENEQQYETNLQGDVVRPSAQECAQNGRARSTKMRWAVKAE